MAEVAGKCSSRKRSNSVDIAEGCMNEAFMSRLRLTHEFKVKGFKGNIRGNSIHGPFITLDELLRALPENVGVDIELSMYPPTEIT
jgi:glycerophosphodiester phosphodiesterase